VLTLAGAFSPGFLLPDALLRFILWLAHADGFTDSRGRADNIPAKGGALFVCNHLSQADASSCSLHRPGHPVFIMFKGILRLAVDQTGSRAF